MKHLKLFHKLAVAVLLLLATICLCSCTEKIPKPSTNLDVPTVEENKMAVIIKDSQGQYLIYMVQLNDDITNVEQLLRALAKQYNVNVVLENSSFGYNPVELADLKASTIEQTFIAFFTSVAQDQGSWAGVPSFDVDGYHIVSAGVGISQGVVQGGQVVYFELSSY